MSSLLPIISAAGNAGGGADFIWTIDILTLSPTWTQLDPDDLSIIDSGQITDTVGGYPIKVPDSEWGASTHCCDIYGSLYFYFQTSASSAVKIGRLKQDGTFTDLGYLVSSSYYDTKSGMTSDYEKVYFLTNGISGYKYLDFSSDEDATSVSTASITVGSYTEGGCSVVKLEEYGNLVTSTSNNRILTLFSLSTSVATSDAQGSALYPHTAIAYDPVGHRIWTVLQQSGGKLQKLDMSNATNFSSSVSTVVRSLGYYQYGGLQFSANTGRGFTFSYYASNSSGYFYSNASGYGSGTWTINGLDSNTSDGSYSSTLKNETGVFYFTCNHSQGKSAAGADVMSITWNGSAPQKETDTTGLSGDSAFSSARKFIAYSKPSVDAQETSY